ncbi:MAG: hypothetical protein ABH877_03255 [bacterium]
MSHLRWALPLALSFGLFACGGENTTAAAPEGGSAASGAAPGSQDSTGATADEPVGKVDEPVKMVDQEVKKVGEEVKQVGEQVGEQVKDVTASATAEADTLIEKITAYLEENKLDLAKTAFAQLATLKDKLPASYQAQIDKISSLIESKGLGDKANNLIKGLGGAGGGK